MTCKLIESLRPDTAFWEKVLNYPVESLAAVYASPEAQRKWIQSLTKAQCEVLLFANAPEMPEKTGSIDYLQSISHTLFNAYLVSLLVQVVLVDSVIGIAKSLLDETWLSRCRKSPVIRDGETLPASTPCRYDKMALLFSVFYVDSAALKTLYRISLLSRTAFRNYLTSALPESVSFDALPCMVTISDIQAALTAFDTQGQTGWRSYVEHMLIYETHYYVVIRRERYPDADLVDKTGLWSSTTEWIGLDITKPEPDCTVSYSRRLRIGIAASRLRDAVILVERLMASAFKQWITLKALVSRNFTQQIKRFLSIITQSTDIADTCLALSSLAVKPLRMHQHTVLTLSALSQSELLEDLHALKPLIGNVMECIERIDFIKLLYCEHEIALFFNRVDREKGEWETTYCAPGLSVTLARQFIRSMKSRYGLHCENDASRFPAGWL